MTFQDDVNNLHAILQNERLQQRPMREPLLHPLIQYIVTLAKRPVDWHQLVLEWPIISEHESAMIAYIRDDGYATTGRRVRTSPGKYLARHWPHIPDHQRRDWVGRFAPGHNFAIWEGTPDIIASIELGPQSCMKSEYGSIPFRGADNNKLQQYRRGDCSADSVDWHKHPYYVYAPEHGWRTAVRLDEKNSEFVLGRALLNGNHWVRSYARSAESGGISCTDEKLETWLREQGYAKIGGWKDGTKMRYHEYDGDLMMPYLDGHNQRVSVLGRTMVVDDDGEYDCSNTNGLPTLREDTDENMRSCDDCGVDVHEEDTYATGLHEDNYVCPSCFENYTMVQHPRAVTRDRGSAHYYVHSDDTVFINNESYHVDDDRLVSTVNDNYQLLDNCVEVDGEYHLAKDCLEVDGEYQLTKDCIEVDGEYHLTKDCVEIYGDWHLAEDCVKINGTWYLSDDHDGWVMIDGEWYSTDDCIEIDDTWYLPEVCVKVGEEWQLLDDCVRIDTVAVHSTWHLRCDCINVGGIWHLEHQILQFEETCHEQA